MAPLAAYAGSWGTGNPSPNIDQGGRWRRRDRRTLEERMRRNFCRPAAGDGCKPDTLKNLRRTGGKRG